MLSMTLIQREYVRLLQDSEYYFCGPSGFMSGLASGLKEWGVPQEQLHYEYFGPYEQ
jgi:ferredoxin-NADP reductase